MKKRYRSLFSLCFAGVLLSIFCPKLMKQYYPTEFCRDNKVVYYLFAKHTWLEGKE